MKKWLILLISAILLVVASVLSISIGRYGVSVKDVVLTLFGQQQNKAIYHVVVNLRLPRLLASLLIGAALAVAGATYQGIFQNPLVSPDLLGVSAGACTGAAIAIIAGLGSFFVTSAAFLIGILSVVLSLLLALATRKKTNLVLIFAGIIVGRFMDSIVGMLIYFADEESKLGEIIDWQLGTMAKVSMSDIAYLAPIVLVCLVFMFLYRWRINLLSIGDRDARALGVNVVADRYILIAISTLLTAVSVCVAGTIAWVGLIVPHIARWIIGSDNRYSIPLCATIGAAFLVFADTIARSATAFELPLGVITGLIGAPIFAVILLNQRKKVQS